MHDTFMNENEQNPLSVPGLSVPQPDFESQFEQDVISKLKSSTPEEILKRKMTEYFEDLGVKPGTKRAKFASMLKEAGRAVQATPERPYVSSKDLMMRAAQTESDKLLPVLQREAATIYGQKKVEAQTASKEKIEAAKIAQAERTNTAKAELQRLKLAAQAGIRGAQEALLAAKTKLIEEEEKNYTKKFETPEMREFTFAQEMAEKYGDNFDDALKNRARMKIASSTPSDQTAMQGMSTPDFTQFMDRRTQLERAKKESKYAPVGGQTSFRIMPTQGTDAEGNPVPTLTAVDPKTLQTIPLDNIKSRDVEQIKRAQASKIGIIQGRESLSAALNSISSGEDVLGPAGGNTLVKFVRSLGWDGTGSLTSEKIRELTAKNTALQHTKVMFNGRFPIAAANQLEEILGGSVKDPRTIARAMAALVYSIEMMQLVDNGQLKASDVDTAFAKKVEQAIDTTVKAAYENRKLKGVAPPKNIALPELRTLITTFKPSAGAQTLKDRVKARFLGTN